MNEVNSTVEKNTTSVKEKKILAKIEKEQKKLDVMTAKRDDIVKKYQAELEKIDAEIKEQEKIVDGYREEEKREKLAKLSNIIGKKGVDIDTFLNAVMNNDLYSVQEMLEKAGKETKEETSSTAPKATSDEPTNSSSTSGMSNNTANGQ